MAPVILITGSTDGIGRETAVQLGQEGKARTIMIHGRNEAKCLEAIEYIKSRCESSTEFGYVTGDFSRLSDISKMVEQLESKCPSLNVVICNAGVLLPQRAVSHDGIEMAFQVNHLAHFALVNLLLPILRKNSPSRIAVVSSICHDWHPMNWTDMQAEKEYEKYVQYSRTKLMNHMFGYAMARRLEGSGVVCNILEPGVVETKLLRNGGFSGSPVAKGAVTPVYLATSETVEGVSGKYFNNNKKEITACAESRDEILQERLWNISLDYCRKAGLDVVEQDGKSIAEKIIDLEKKQCAELMLLTFPLPVTVTYNPLVYAWEPHEEYIRKFCDGKKKVIFLGMNPGPFGMSQTGVPFGEISHVRDFLGITGRVDKPAEEHPKRLIEGFDCKRSEVSGSRLWSFISELSSGDPMKFFKHCYIHNYCPLAFLNSTGKNITPAALPKSSVLVLEEICDRYLLEVFRALEPNIIVAVGGYAAEKTKAALKRGSSPVFNGMRVETILHPSPINPAANKPPGWASRAKQQLLEIGVLDLIE